MCIDVYICIYLHMQYCIVCMVTSCIHMLYFDMLSLEEEIKVPINQSLLLVATIFSLFNLQENVQMLSTTTNFDC